MRMGRPRRQPIPALLLLLLLLISPALLHSASAAAAAHNEPAVEEGGDWLSPNSNQNTNNNKIKPAKQRAGSFTGGPLHTRDAVRSQLETQVQTEEHGAPNRDIRGAYHTLSESNKFFGCFMPKAGCTSWLKYLKEQLLGMSFDTRSPPSVVYSRGTANATRLYFRNTMSGEDTTRFQRDVFLNPEIFKFAVVRHPWERLVSGFRSKYEGRCNFSRRCIARRFSVPVYNESRPGHLTPTTPLSFHEFVQALARVPHRRKNHHFQPQAMLCELSTIPYDFVAELDLPADTDLVSHRLGFNTTFQAHFELSESRATYQGAVYYGGRTHRVHNCTRETVDIAAEIYAIDAQILGFNFDKAYHSCSTVGRTSLEEA
eukprot:m.131852 g.131852  ORF g.131852 m.131852 type:complete len:372 (-) comp16474_c2_seq1:269-1384(-)